MHSRTKLIVAAIAVLASVAVAYWLLIWRPNEVYREAVRQYEAGNYVQSLTCLRSVLEKQSFAVSRERRARATELLIEMGATSWAAEDGDSGDVIKLLQLHLSNDDSLVRKAAVKALGMDGESRVMEPIISSLSDTDARVRREAVCALASVALVRSSRRNDVLSTSIDSIVPAMNDPDDEVRQSAAIALGLLREPASWFETAYNRRDDPRAIEPLEKGLKDDSPAVRVYSYWALDRVLAWSRQDREARPRLRAEAALWLVDALEHEDQGVRYKAAWALRTFYDARALEPLIQSLRDEYQPVRVAAAQALGRSDAESAITPLIDALGDEDSVVRYHAAAALGNIGQPIVKPLAQVFQTGNAQAQVAAARALGLSGCESAFEQLDVVAVSRHLNAALGSDDVILRREAAEAMGLLRHSTFVKPLINALGDPHRDVRYEAAQALGRIKDPSAVGPLISTLQNDAQPVRARAAEALGEIKDPSAVDALVSTINQGDDASVGHFASEALIKIGPPAVERLIADLDYRGGVFNRPGGGFAKVRVGSTGYPFPNRHPMTLARIGQPAVAPLIEALEDRHPTVRGGAILALGNLWIGRYYIDPTVSVLDAEHWVLRGPSQESHQRTDFWAPTNQRKPLPAILQVKVYDWGDSKMPTAWEKESVEEELVDALIERLSDEHPRPGESGWEGKRVREWAAVVLGHIGNARAVDALIHALDDPESTVARDAARALVRIGGAEAIDALVQASASENESIRKQAVWALDAIMRRNADR